MRVLLLSLLVFGHFLCLVCHATATSAEALTDADMVPVSVQTASGTASGVALHGLNEDGQSIFDATEGDVSVDQRLIAEEVLMLLVLGVILVVVFWAVPPRPGPWFVRRPLVMARSGPPLFLSLCIQRV